MKSQINHEIIRNKLQKRVYQRETDLNLKRLLKELSSDIRKSGFLARQLAERDIKAQYRQSYLGIIWAFLNPVLTAAVWVFLNISGTIQVTDTGIPYPVYAFSGTLLWSIMVGAINSPSQSTNSARSLLNKLNFPKEALIFSGILKLLFDSSVKIILLIIFVFLFDIGFHWSLLLVPFAILVSLIFGTTIGLFLTPFQMLYKDIAKITTFGLSFIMYVTPVVYAIPKEGILKTIMEINPITPIIITGRDFLTGSEPEYLGYFLTLFFTSLPLFFIALIIYRLSIPVIVERLSA